MNLISQPFMLQEQLRSENMNNIVTHLSSNNKITSSKEKIELHRSTSWSTENMLNQFIRVWR